jgi:hypothetical protein
VPLPPFTSVGGLPPGVHWAVPEQGLDRFGRGSRQRMFFSSWTTRSRPAHWQVKREGGRRGIVEITEEIP